MSYQTRARTQLRMLLDVYGEAGALRTALDGGTLDGGTFWESDEQQGCVLGTVLHAFGDEDPARTAFGLRGFESLEAWSQHIAPGDIPAADRGEESGPYRAAMLVQWIDEWEAERVTA